VDNIMRIFSDQTSNSSFDSNPMIFPSSMTSHGITETLVLA